MTDRRSLVVLVFVHLAVVSLVQPRGDFPLNDDWAYAHSVQWLLGEHRIRLSDWVAMNLLPQTLLGGAVTALAGFSFETLRHLTQAVALAALGATYAAFRGGGLGPRDALFATLVVAAFPAWPVLANSYMTDLYGFALLVAAAALLAGSLQQVRVPMLWAGTALAATGVLERQVVLAVPCAFAIAFLWGRRLSRRDVFLALAPLVVTMAAEVGYRMYLEAGPGVPPAQDVAHGRVA